MKTSQQILTSFGQFDLLMNASHETGLIIADDSDFDVLIQILNHFNFQPANKIDDLMKQAKLYMVIGDSLDKDIYDFAVQYPLGRIEILNHNNMQTRISMPDFDNQSIVFLIKKGNLDSLNKKGFDLRTVTGPAFQI